MKTWDDAILAALSPEAEAAARAIARRPAWAGLAPSHAEVWGRFGAAIVRAHPDVHAAGLRALSPPGVTYFASGSNDGEAIHALVALGIHPGVAVQAVNPETSRALRVCAEGRGLRAVFIDSGAFSERASGERMTEEDWDQRLGRYEELVRGLAGEGVQVYVVAPDCVGDQGETLRRLRRYRDRVRALARAGAQVIVAVQLGERSMAAFWRAELEILGPGDWIAGIPCKRGATSPRAFAAFMAAARPARVHLLGLGPTRATFPAYLAAAAGAAVSCDSGLIRRLAGRTNGAGGQPRAITRARDRLAYLGDDGLITYAAAVAGISAAQRADVAQVELFAEAA